MPGLDTNLEQRALAVRAEHPDWGYRVIAKEIGWDRHRVRRAIEHAERKAYQLAPVGTHNDLPSLVNVARQALIAAKNVGDVIDVRHKAEALRILGRIANDHELEADAAQVRLNAERKLGTMLAAEKEAGTLGPGRNRPKVNGSSQEPLTRVTLEEIGVTKKLSTRAQKLAAIPDRVFEKAVDRVRDRIKAGADVSLDITGETKTERRATRERVLGGIQLALPTQKFGVILADPEWRFEPWSRETGMDRAADNHYPTSATEVIAARDVISIAADDCVLFLWATVPMLPHALIVMAAWGFDYKSHCVWIKDQIGTGYWFRNGHELLLVGTRGNIPAPAMGEQWPSVIAEPVGKHSEKPEAALRMIEQYFPTLPKIELNRRGPPHEGWSAWGNEAVQQRDGNSPNGKA
jgi:N6-adenosine-specific RNA methylase IME4